MYLSLFKDITMSRMWDEEGNCRTPLDPTIHSLKKGEKRGLAVPLEMPKLVSDHKTTGAMLKDLIEKM